MMGWIFTVMLGLSTAFALGTNKGSQLAGAIIQGAQSGITLCLGMAGAICLWTGVGKLMEKAGFTGLLARLLQPVLHRVFPETKEDPVLASHLSANICANILGLGNAATPMGIQAAQRLAEKTASAVAGDSLCRLIVLNTASIQLIPSTVAALRSGLGCQTPFDILPAVWITSFCSAGLGLTAAWALGKVWRCD